MRPVGSSVQAYDAFISYSHAVDGKLAPAIQSGLHRFAKSWYRLRALRVFRDETSLSATPELWPSIVDALDRSRWLILLASPDAARSTWVNDEVTHWCATHSTKQIVVVITKDDREGDFDWKSTTALPPALRERLSHEPRVVDLRWAAAAADVSLQNARFRDAIADVAAPLHGRPKDELHGEDVRQHRRTRRIARAAVVTLATLLAVAVGAAVIAVDQQSVARKQRDRAERQARLALSRALAAEATAASDDQLDLAFLLAAQSYTTMPTPESRRSLLQTLLRSPHLTGLLPGTAGATRVAFSPRGQLLAVGMRDGNVSLWSPEPRRRVLSLRARRGAPVTSLAFSGDGRRLVAGTDETIAVWDVGTGQSLAEGSTGTSRVTSVALDQRGSIFAAAEANGRARVWATAGGHLLHTFRLRRPVFPPLQVAIPGDDTIALGDKRRRLTRWDLSSNALLRAFPAEGTLIGPPDVSAYSPDMRRFAGVWLGRPDVRTPVVFDVTRPRKDRLLDGPAAAIEAMTFGRDGQMLATAADGRVVLWSVPRERALDDALSGVPGTSSAVTVSPDGQLIAAAGQRGVAVWDLRKQALLHSLESRGAHPGLVAPAWQGAQSAAFSPDGRLLAWALGVDRNRIVVWRLGDAKEILRFPAARVVGFSPDGKQLAAENDYKSDFIVVDLDTRERRRMHTLPWKNNAVEGTPTSYRPWTADGRKGVGASAALDGTVTLWDTRSGQPIGTLRAPGVVERPFLAFDRAGQKLAIVTAGGALTVVDLAVPSWRAQACRLAGRTLTLSEWRSVVGTTRRGSSAC